MDDELERIWKEVAEVFSWLILKELSKTSKNIQGSRCSGQDSNRAPPDYECTALPLLQPTPELSCYVLSRYMV
jgi:hypothetical protein